MEDAEGINLESLKVRFSITTLMEKKPEESQRHGSLDGPRSGSRRPSATPKPPRHPNGSTPSPPLQNWDR